MLDLEAPAEAFGSVGIRLCGMYAEPPKGDAAIFAAYSGGEEGNGGVIKYGTDGTMRALFVDQRGWGSFGRQMVVLRYSSDESGGFLAVGGVERVGEGTRGAIVVLGANDLSEHRRIVGESQSFGATLVSVPDSDGDSIEDIYATEDSLSAVRFIGSVDFDIDRSVVGLKGLVPDAGGAVVHAGPAGRVVLLGAPMAGQDSGGVLQLSASSGESQFHEGARLVGDVSAGVGVSIANVGDWNADGFDEWCVGAPGKTVPEAWDPDGIESAGEVLVVCGKTRDPLLRLRGRRPGACVGYQVVWLPSRASGEGDTLGALAVLAMQSYADSLEDSQQLLFFVRVDTAN